jgi:hypothetical protein
LRQVPCHSHALSDLLQDLFGEESTDHTPDLPELDVVEGADPFALAPPGVFMEMDAEPATPTPKPLGAFAPSALSSSSHVSLRLPLAAALPDHRLLARRLIAGIAAGTLVACLSWAMWRGKRHHPAAVAKEVASPTQQRASDVPGLVLPHPASAPSTADPNADDDQVLTDSAPSATHAHAAKKRSVRHLSSDVTIDPFK